MRLPQARLLWTERVTPVLGQARLISIRTRVDPRAPRSLPPYASGTVMPQKPISAHIPTCSATYVSVASFSAARGASSLSAKSLAASWSICRSSESSKSMGSSGGGRGPPGG